MESVLSGFSKVGTGRLYNGWSSHFDNEIGFSQEFLLKNHLLLSCYLGFDWSGWTGLIERLIIIATGMVWPVISDKWKAAFMCEFAVLGLLIFFFFIFFLFVVREFFLYLDCSIRLDLFLKKSFNWIEKELYISLKCYYILKSVEYIVLSRFFNLIFCCLRFCI